MADAEQTVFGLKDNTNVMRNVIGDFGRKSDAERNDVAFGKLLGNAFGNDLAALFFRKFHQSVLMQQYNQ